MDKLKQKQPASEKKSDEIAVRIMLGIGFVLALIMVFALIKLLPICSSRGINAISIFEIVCLPIMVAMAFFASGAIYNKMKKLPPAKRVEMESPEKVPLEVLIKLLLVSYCVSLVICILVGAIFSRIYKGACSEVMYATCGSGVLTPFLAFFYPMTVIGAVIAGYKVSYLLLVPLSEVGHFPNGRKIMKHVAPKKTMFMVLGAGVLAAAIVLALVIIQANSI